MYRQSERNLLNSNTSSTSKCPHNMVNFGPLSAEIGVRVWGTPANFNGFCVLASLLHRRRSTDVNQTLRDVWPSHALAHYIYISGGCCLLTEFQQLQNPLCVQILRSPILAALLRGTRAVGISQTAVFSRGRHLYSTGRPSCWASAHILVCRWFAAVLRCRQKSGSVHE